MTPVTPHAYVCSVPGCPRTILVGEPLAPVLCASCAFWRLLGRATTLYRPLHGAGDIYYLDPDEDVRLMDACPVITLRLEDGTEIVSKRVRCLGLMDDAPVTFALLSVTPRAPIGVR